MSSETGFTSDHCSLCSYRPLINLFLISLDQSLSVLQKPPRVLEDVTLTRLDECLHAFWHEDDRGLGNNHSKKNLSGFT